ncbi:MAG: hypothetical protein ACXWQO_07785 [Bdellovibrionota bacterium]
MKNTILTGTLAFLSTVPAWAGDVCYGDKCEFIPRKYLATKVKSMSEPGAFTKAMELHLLTESGHEVSLVCLNKDMLWTVTKNTTEGRKDEFDRGSNIFSSSDFCLKALDKMKSNIDAGKKVSLGVDSKGLKVNAADSDLLEQSVGSKTEMQSNLPGDSGPKSTEAH